MSTCHTRIPSPVGELLVIRDELGLTALYLPGGKHPSDDPGGSPRDDTAFDDVRGQLEQYFAGTRREFDLPLHATGTPWQHRVWDELTRIPWGQTRGYGQLAAQLGAPSAARAVGTANGRNPLSIIVPCHRVVGANGALTGYAGGVAAKQWLLSHEKAVA